MKVVKHETDTETRNVASKNTATRNATVTAASQPATAKYAAAKNSGVNGAVANTAASQPAAKSKKRKYGVLIAEGVIIVTLAIVLIVVTLVKRGNAAKEAGVPEDSVLTSEEAAAENASSSASIASEPEIGEASGSANPQSPGSGSGAEGTGAEGSGGEGGESGAAPGEGENGTSGQETDNGPAFSPHAVESTEPSNYIAYTETMFNDDFSTPREDYDLWYDINFGLGETYTDVEGIIGFRGNNFRNSPTYGYAEMTDYTINKVWTRETGSLTYDGKTWSGSGWTGQPLIVKWPAETKAIMNMYDWAKEDDSVVEVIYACLDGRIYFTDLETGRATRDTMYVGYAFKGAGALDPRGYPIMYVGAGYDSDLGRSRSFIISLIDCTVLYTFGNADSFSLRGTLSYFDSSALVDAASDTLIYPGENGILYLIKLNTQYDEAAGTLSIDPGDIIKWRYYGTRTSSGSYWLGMEDSACIYKGYIFMSDNGGNLMCLDLNTLRLVWTQNILDDSNGSPVLSVENDHVYLYISTSFHLGWRSDSTATVPVWKIDAETGEIIWHTDYTCYSQSGVSGGVQSTMAVGEHDFADYVYVTVARTGSDYGGVLACLRKDTGEVVWEHEAVYAWSSPVIVYNEDGSGAILYCSCGGKMYLLNGKDGATYDAYVLRENGVIEASPAVYENKVVVGTKECLIWCFELK